MKPFVGVLLVAGILAGIATSHSLDPSIQSANTGVAGESNRGIILNYTATSQDFGKGLLVNGTLANVMVVNAPVGVTLSIVSPAGLTVASGTVNDLGNVVFGAVNVNTNGQFSLKRSSTHITSFETKVWDGQPLQEDADRVNVFTNPTTFVNDLMQLWPGLPYEVTIGQTHLWDGPTPSILCSTVDFQTKDLPSGETVLVHVKVPGSNNNMWPGSTTYRSLDELPPPNPSFGEFYAKDVALHPDAHLEIYYVVEQGPPGTYFEVHYSIWAHLITALNPGGWCGTPYNGLAYPTVRFT